MYNVFPVLLRASSAASFILWLSPPDRVTADCPRRTYPSPTSTRAFSFGAMVGIFSKNSYASLIGISSTSLMFFPLYLTASVSFLYLRPRHSLQTTFTEGRKFISMTLMPAPLHSSHLPPGTLNENLPALNPRTLASGVASKRFLISLNTPVNVAGLLRGVRPIGLWSISISLSIFSTPTISS